MSIAPHHAYCSCLCASSAPSPPHLYLMEQAGSSRAEVDTSRPFRSVREAVEVFRERSLLGSFHQAPPSSPARTAMLDYLKKLEAELSETRQQVALLKEKGSEMELAVSSLSTQLSKSMPVVSELKGAKEADADVVIEEETGEVRSDRWDEDRAAGLEYLPSLSEALAVRMLDEEFGERGQKSNKKQRHAMPLVGGIFAKKNKSR